MSETLDFLKNTKKISDSLKKVSKKVEKSIEIDDDSVSSAVEQTVTSGKMVRPLVTLLFTQLLKSEVDDKAISLASAVEVLHNATLIHDDIVDNSDLRRGVSTLNAKFSEDVAVYSGDLLFVSMYKLLNDAEDLNVNKMAVNTLFEILNGELTQKRNRFNIDMTFDDYNDQVYGKTAALFELAAYFGSVDTTEFIDLAKAFGYNLGMAFQTMDDYLDYQSDSKNAEKPLNQDLKRGIYTAPVLFAFEENPSIKQQITNQEFPTVIQQIRNSNSLIKTKELVYQYTKNAADILDEFKDSKFDQPARIALLKLTELLKDRVK